MVGSGTLCPDFITEMAPLPWPTPSNMNLPDQGKLAPIYALGASAPHLFEFLTRGGSA